MNSLINGIKARFFNAGPANDSCELKTLKYKGKNAKDLNAPEPRAQHSPSSKFALASLFDRISFPLPGFLRRAQAETSLSSKVSETLDKLAAASEGNNSREIIDSLKALQELDSVHAGGLDGALQSHLLRKSKYKGSHYSLRAAQHLQSLAEANPLKLKALSQIGTDESLNQFHADLMRRLEKQFDAAFNKG
jgi:hypothetical protein